MSDLRLNNTIYLMHTVTNAYCIGPDLMKEKGYTAKAKKR